MTSLDPEKSILDSFLTATEQGNALLLLAFSLEGFNINAQDKNTGETALHIAAACRSHKTLKVLLETEKCDFLLRDRRGRLASEMAYLHGNDPVVARLLGIKERKQGAAQGIKVTRRP